MLKNLFKTESRKIEYPNKTIILPKQFMKEYNLVSDMEHIKEMLEGYNVLQKEVFVNVIFGKGKKQGLIEENTRIEVIDVNSDVPCGLIIEDKYYCFFVEVFATNNKTNKKFRAGIYLVVILDKHLKKISDTNNKLKFDVIGGNGYGFIFYDFKDNLIKSVVMDENKHANKKVITWYLSVISQFLDIMGQSMVSPSNWKPK